MPKRGRGGRFVTIRRGRMGRSRRSYPRFRRFRQRVSGGIQTVRTRVRGAFSGLPKWARPSNFTAAAGVGSATLQLAFIPLSDGDSWLRRLQQGYAAYQSSQNPFDILNMDTDGNNALSIAALQLKQNAAPAVGTLVGFGLGAAVLRYFGM